MCLDAPNLACGLNILAEQMEKPRSATTFGGILFSHFFHSGSLSTSIIRIDLQRKKYEKKESHFFLFQFSGPLMYNGTQ